MHQTEYQKTRNNMPKMRTGRTKEPEKPRTPQKKEAKNYNYKRAEAKELQENPTALGRVSESQAREIESSLEPKRKAFIQDYNAGTLKKSALKDSIASTLRDGSKVKDFMPVKYKPKPKKVEYWVGGSADNPWVRWESPQIFPNKPKKNK